MYRFTCLLLLFATGAAFAAPSSVVYKVGDSFASFSTKDQHDKSYSYEGGARLVLIAFEMGTGKAANAFLETQPADFLSQHHAVYISNILGMPGIARVFALPKMKKYQHRILLADAEGFLDRYPRLEDNLTVLSLDANGIITSIRHVNPKKELPSVFSLK